MNAISRRATIGLALLAPLLVSGCGRGDGITYDVDGKASKLETKSAMYYSSTMTYSAPNVESQVCLSTTVNLANYVLDGSSGLRSMGKDVTEGQVRLSINLLGAEGTRGVEATEPAAEGVYKVGAEKFNTVRSATIYTFGEGKQQKYFFSDKMKGTVTVTKSAGGAFTAEVDLSDDKSAIKGSFEAKSWK